ncbi:hypothetical protein PMAYCL1PPCAC_25524, partial [Pristionchus mayeri]
LTIVPLDTRNSILCSPAVSDAHPWRFLFLDRPNPPANSPHTPLVRPAPVSYSKDAELNGPPVREEAPPSPPPSGASNRGGFGTFLRGFGRGSSVHLHEVQNQ